jgi:PTS system nitrogen regulatory IIA component
MITIADILRPEHIDLDVKQTSQQEAVLHVANLLRNDERVLDWMAFYEGLIVRPPTLAPCSDFEICIPHARTNSVASMIMSIGRSNQGITLPGREMKMHYIFAIGVPVAWAADYLRIVGALARIFKNPQAEARLRKVGNAEAFAAILREKELAP